MFEDLDPFTARPAELLASVADMEPGPMVMSVLLMIDRSALSPADAVTFVQIHERQASWWASVQVHAVVAAASGHAVVEELMVLAPPSAADGQRVERQLRIADACRDELAAALRIPGSTAQDVIDTARLLVGPLGETGEALSLGDITPGHVRTMVEAAERLPGAATAQHRDPRDDGDLEVAERKAFATACQSLQDRVLPVARRSTRSLTRRAANRAILVIDAAGSARRRRESRCMRDVFVVDEPDGLSLLMARLSTPAAHAVMAEVDALAHHPDLEVQGGATMGERRAEALTALVLADRSDSDALPHSRLRAHVDVVIDLPTLLGLQDHRAELVGSGAVAADVVRDLLADPQVAATMRRLVSDPITGHLLDIGRKHYEIPTGLRRLVVARDRVCRFPGCRRSATRCQVDHAVAWDDGGGSDLANLGALCTRHHQLKTHGGWGITESHEDGSCTWTSPQGRTYRHEPEPALAVPDPPDPPPS